MKRNILIIASVLIALFVFAPIASAGQTARVIAPTCAYKNPGFGQKVKCLGTVAPYGGGPLQLAVIRSVPGEMDPNTGQLRRYYLVRLPYRPNGLIGWISSDRIVVKYNPYRIAINRGTRTARLYKKGVIVLKWRVVVGASSTPTPSGNFAIYGKTDRDHGFDGTGILPFAYSNVWHQFQGGNGKLAIHGRSGSSLNTPLGTAGSNGCVRSNNNIVQYLLDKVPVGTHVKVA